MDHSVASWVTTGADRRAQSETLGYVLVFGIMLLGALVVVGLGANAISDTEDRIGDDRAEQTLTQLDAKAALVALGDADTQRVDFGGFQEGSYRVQSDTGWMNVTYQNLTDGYTEEVLNFTLGEISYNGGADKIAYQGGGVFRENDHGGQMISPPEFHFRNGTLTLPAINITGDSGLANYAHISQGEVSTKFPDESDDNFTNPLDNHLVTVTVNSEFYRGWGRYFEQRTDGDVEYDDENEIVTATLVSPIEQTSVSSAASSLSAEGDFHVSGRPDSRCADADDRFSDSYNSSATDLDYCDQLTAGMVGNQGDIIYGGDIDISSGSGGGDFCGDIVSGGSVLTADQPSSDGPDCGDGGGGAPTVYGNINYTDDCPYCESDIADTGEYETNRISGLETISPINWYIDNQVELIADTVGGTNDSELVHGAEFDAGEYNFTDFTMADDERVELNTTEGNIDIAVWESISMGRNSTIKITGDNRVDIYVGGENVGGGNHLDMDNNAVITTVGDNATQLTLHGKDDFTAVIGGGSAGDDLAKFTGVIFAPPGSQGYGRVTIDFGEIYGGLVTGTTEIPSRGSLHFDEALDGVDAIEAGAKVVRLTYLHVTLNEIRVE